MKRYEYQAMIEWERNNAPFVDLRYSRGHQWDFDGGVRVPASSSPHVVPIPQSVAAAVDPEEAFVASLASCHMLWFLSIAAKRGYVIDRYRDSAVGVMARNEEGRLAILEVTLRPQITFAAGRQPDAAEHTALHHEAHESCFIANSVKTNVRCEATISPAPIERQAVLPRL